MKMVKSLLLGSAAGLVAVAGAQAADLPVKAKPVEYVKICSLYGVGFYYIPGTDMCIKIGGWVRAEYAWGVNGSSTQTYGANPYLNNRATNNSWWRVRGYITADARNQTEYGTVRGYIAVGISTDDLGAGEQQSFNANRAFIQWAGFTFGRAASFLTSMLARRCLTSGSIRSPILVTAARTSSPIRHNSATASRPRLLPNCRGGRRSLG